MNDDADFYSLSGGEDAHDAAADEFLPFDDHRRLVADSSNESSDVRSVASAEVIGVALYPVVTWFAVLLTLSSVGLVGNVVVVVAAAALQKADACRRGRRRLRRASTALVANLGVALTATCVVDGPLQFALVAENYVKRAVPSFICRAAAACYHLLAGAVVASLVLYSLTRRRRLRRASDVRRSSSSSRNRRSPPADAPGTCSASCRRQLASLRGSSATAAGGVDVLPSCRCDKTSLSLVVMHRHHKRRRSIQDAVKRGLRKGSYICPPSKVAL